MPQYVYTTVRPKVGNNWRADDVPGHAFGYRRRRDMLVPGEGALEYRSHCQCKWQAPEWRGSVRLATLDHDKHARVVLDTQPQLF